MKAIENILQKRFGNSKKLSIFVVPRDDNDYRSNRYISTPSFNKAGFLSDNSTPVVLRFLAETEWRSASFFYTYYKFLVRTMPRNDKNLNAAAPGAAASTGRNRNSAPVVTQSATTQSQPTEDTISPTPYSLLKEQERLNRALKAAEKATQAAAKMTAKQLYRVSINCAAITTLTPHRYVGIYHTDVYPAISRHEAVGLAVVSVANKHPNFHVDIKSLKCEIVNPSTLFLN